MAQRYQYSSDAVDDSGDVISGAQVEVRDEAGSLATLYAADTGATLAYSGANPFTAGTGSPDPVGAFTFFVDPGKYTVKVGVGATARTYPLHAGIPHRVTFANRAAAQAAYISTGTDRIAVISPSGETLRYVKNASGTALTTADGANWAAEEFPAADHFAENTTPGTTDMKAALSAALTASGKVGLVDDLRVTMATGTNITIPANRTLTGEPGATLSAAYDIAGTGQLFSRAADVRAVDLSVQVVAGSSTNTVIGFNAGDNFSLENVTYDGAVFDDGGAPSHVSHVVSLDSGAATGMSVVGGTFTNVSRLFLKSNANTHAHKDLRVIGTRAEGVSAEYLAVNNPTGTFESVVYGFNQTRDFIGTGFGTSNHVFGGANVTGIIGIGNIHIGAGDEILHFEEGTNGFVGIGNVAKFSDARAGVRLVDNNVDGTYVGVLRGVISSNVLRRDTRGSAFGIDLASNGVGVAPTTETVISNNVASGWSVNARMAEDPYRNLLTNNILHDGDEGIQVLRPTMMAHGNLLVDNAVEMDFQTGGLMGHQYIAKSAAWTGAAALIPTPATTSVANTAGSLGWTVEYRPLTIAATGTNYLVIPLGRMMSGTICAAINHGSTTYRFVRGDLDWDGTTLTWTVARSYGTGITFVDFRNDGAGNLALRLSSASVLSNATAQFTFSGIHVHA